MPLAVAAHRAQGKLALGIKASNGVVLCTDKKLPSTLVDEKQVRRRRHKGRAAPPCTRAPRQPTLGNSLTPRRTPNAKRHAPHPTQVQKLEEITPSCGMVYAGLGPDYRVLVKTSRKSAQKYYTTYHEQQPIPMLVKDTASVCQEYTQPGGVRPFGVSLLVAGYDDDGPHLFQVDPSGAYFGWKATAIGKNFKNARSFLERRFNEEMELVRSREGCRGLSCAIPPCLHHRFRVTCLRGDPTALTPNHLDTFLFDRRMRSTTRC